MRSQAYPSAKADIPEDGTYHLFVRSHGGADCSFRVTVGERQTSERFGDGPLGWKPGGTFELKKGEDAPDQEAKKAPQAPPPTAGRPPRRGRRGIRARAPP
mgnify:CR=1 FL=1